MVILSPEEVKNAEKTANENGLGYDVMMLAAGNGCADFMIERYPGKNKIVVVCGKGKNGGDGFVCAKRLCASGISVSVLLALGTPSDPLALRMLKDLEGYAEITDCSGADAFSLRALDSAEIIVDAIFGIGFRGKFTPPVAGTVEKINASGAIKIAIDLPSGLGEGSEESRPVRADITLSMLCCKKEHIFKPSSFYCGKTYIIPIGFEPPAGALNSLSISDAAALLPERPYNANKGTFGNVLILGGSGKMPGAAVLAATGALNGGAGLVTLGMPDCCIASAQAQLSEPVFMPLVSSPDGNISEKNIFTLASELHRFSAVVLGNGMGVSGDTKAVTEFVIKNSDRPVVLDADGINCLSGNILLLKEARCPVLVTPHPGEMGRLAGMSAERVNERREEIAAEFAARYGVFVLLKGANTVIASPDGKTFINPTGCTALSRGGSGDLLAGLVGALAAQGADLFDAAVLGAYVHGLAGEIAQTLYSPYSATTNRISECIGPAFKKIIEGQC